MADLILAYDLPQSALGHLTSVVQLGFISGTLLFAILMIADRISPSKVFFFCAVSGGLINLTTLLPGNHLSSLLIERGLVGFFLAGIYPVGMKIAADYYHTGLGRSLGYLVGALVLGTAFPHIVSSLIGTSIAWKDVIICSSMLAFVGGLSMLIFVKDGPYRKASLAFDIKTIPRVFQDKSFRAAAFGYFGHMWELYAFWAFIPVTLVSYQEIHQREISNESLLAGAIIGVGGLSCVLGGELSKRVSAKKLASSFLLASGLCCLVSPLIFQNNSVPLFLGFLIFWGLVVIADSPLFSSLVATHAPAASKGTALTIVNCIGFAITIVSIQLLTSLIGTVGFEYLFLVLSIGPIFGLLSLRAEKS